MSPRQPSVVRSRSFEITSQLRRSKLNVVIRSSSKHLMKAFLFTLLALSFCVANAQQPQIPVLQRSIPPRMGTANFTDERPSLPENYLLTLTVLEKEQVVTEMSLVLAAPEFTTNFPDAKSAITTFTGTILPEEGGTVLVRYAIGAEVALPVGEGQTQYKSISTQASVRLKPGEPVQIMKTDARSCRLSVVRLADHPAKTK